MRHNPTKLDCIYNQKLDYKHSTLVEKSIQPTFCVALRFFLHSLTTYKKLTNYYMLSNPTKPDCMYGQKLVLKHSTLVENSI
jgi:hypothetical protein